MDTDSFSVANLWIYNTVHETRRAEEQNHNMGEILLPTGVHSWANRTNNKIRSDPLIIINIFRTENQERGGRKQERTVPQQIKLWPAGLMLLLMVTPNRRTPSSPAAESRADEKRKKSKKKTLDTVEEYGQ